MKNARIVIKGKTYSLARGKVARVYYSRKSPCGEEKPLRFWKKVAGKEKTSWHTFDELERINAVATEMNRSANVHGLRFAIPSRDEMTAVWHFREFAKKRRSAGETVPLFSNIVIAALARESEMDVTPKFSDAIADYIAEKRAAGEAGARYIRSTGQILRWFESELGDKKLGDVKIPEVEDAVAKGDFSPNTRRMYVAAIRGLFSWYYKHENAARKPIDRIINPLELLKIPSVKKTKEPEIISPKQLREYLEEVRTVRPKLLPAVIIQAFCGVRRAEALRLKWKDIRDGFVFLSCEITKTRITRVAPLPDCAVAWLAPFKKRDPESFIAYPQLQGADREDQVYNKTWKYISKGLPKNALRHSAATYLAQIYGNSKAADICGHDSRTAGVYYRAASTPEVAKAWFNVFPA